MAKSQQPSAHVDRQTSPDETPAELGARLKDVIRIGTEVLLKRGVSAERASEIALRAAAILWKGRGQPGGYDLSPPVDGYVARMVLNLIAEDKRAADADDERDAGFQREIESEEPLWMSAESKVLTWDLERLYHRALTRLPKDRREVWLRKQNDRATTASIALERGIREATVRVHLLNASRAISEALHQYLKDG